MLYESRLGEYEIAFIVRRTSAQLHGNGKLLVAKRRRRRKNEGRIRAGRRRTKGIVDEKEQRRRLH